MHSALRIITLQLVYCRFYRKLHQCDGARKHSYFLVRRIRQSHVYRERGQPKYGWYACQCRYVSYVTSYLAGIYPRASHFHPLWCRLYIQITSDAAAQLYAGVPASQAISNARWSIPRTSKFPITRILSGTPFKMTERDTIVKQADGSCIGQRWSAAYWQSWRTVYAQRLHVCPPIRTL